MKHLTILLLTVVLFSCHTKEDDTVEPNPSDAPNILLIIADDMGKDATSGFAEGSTKPNTPNLDKIKNEGLVFNNLWANPTCSPTRASIITGKYGYRTGVKWANDELASSEMTLQRYISEGTDGAYATAVIGKWHLSGAGATANPESYGIDHYAGLVRGAVQDYYQWQLTEDGNGSLQTEYISKVFTDLSIDWVSNQTKPWFLWLAYNAPHTPFHTPPDEMHSQGSLPDYTDGLDPTPYYMAAIEAMDYQIGRLIAEIPDGQKENTVIIFLADNGTPNQVAQSPYLNNKAKGSLYQGGINVPMFISGKGVAKVGEDNSLIGVADLFSTIANLAGAEATEYNDSKSFTGLLSNGSSSRAYQYSEMNNGSSDLWAISNGKFKLIVSADGSEEMYELDADPYEDDNLLNEILTAEAETAKSELEAELLEIRN